jgi:hypothetical protein
LTIRLVDGLDDLNFLVGTDFPDADEDALWRSAAAWSRAAADLRALSPEAVAAGLRVLELLGGAAGSSFATAWQQFAADGDGLIERLARACDELAAACDSVAVEVEYAKIQYIAALVVLGATIAGLVAAIWAGGVSAAGIPLAIAAAQATIRLVIMRLLAAAVLGAGVNAAVDLVAQSIQLGAGHRDRLDLSLTARAIEDGAVYGAVGGGVFLAGGRLLPGLLSTPVGLAGAAGVTGLVGGVAAPLLHGELPTARDVLLATTSGLIGGLGPDLGGRAGHGRPAPAPDVPALDASAPAAAVHLFAQPWVPVGALDAGPAAPARADAAGGRRPGDGPGLGGPVREAAPAERTPAERIVSQGGPSTGPRPVEPAGHPGGPLLRPAPDAAPAVTSTPAPGPAGAGGSAPSATPGPVVPPGPAAAMGQATVGPAAGIGPGTALGPGTAVAPGAAAGPGGSAPGSGAPAASALGTAAPGPGTTAGAGVGPSVVVAAGPIPGSVSGPFSSPASGAVSDPGDSRAAPLASADDGAAAVAWELTDVEAVELVRTNVFDTPAGYAFYAVDDEVRDFARAVVPADGLVTLDLHGSPHGFEIDEALISPVQFAGALRALIDEGAIVLPPGHGIKLLSCDTATGGDQAPAAQLARAIGVPVIAPDLPVWTALDGEEVVASPVLVDGLILPAEPPDGGWHRFDPDGLVIPLGPTVDGWLNGPIPQTMTAAPGARGLD